MRPFLLVFVACAACQNPFVPDPEPVPEGAVPFVAPAYFDTLWADVRKCSGLVAMKPSGYYVIPSDTGVTHQGVTANAFYQPRAHRIVFASWVLDDSHDAAIRAAGVEPHRLKVIRHEMLHAHGMLDHPTEYFVTRCGAMVSH